MQIQNFIILFLSIITTNAFDLGLWRGSTNFYMRNNDKIDLNKPIVSIYNNTYNFNKSFINNGRFLKLKLQSYDKLGGFFVKIDRNIDNSYYFTNEINFFHNTVRSIITIDYIYNSRRELQLNTISASALRCGLNRIGKLRNKLLNLTEFKDKLKTWQYCKCTKVNPMYPFNNEVVEYNCYDYEYLLINKNRISHVFTDNLIISIPEIIDENKPFTLLFGCLISAYSYKQVNLNYNFNGRLVSIEFNEYQPFDNYVKYFRK